MCCAHVGPSHKAKQLVSLPSSSAFHASSTTVLFRCAQPRMARVVRMRSSVAADPAARKHAETGPNWTKHVATIDRDHWNRVQYSELILGQGADDKSWR